MAAKHLTQEAFDAALSSKQPVLVDFYADWCGPCKMLAPVVEQIAQENPDYAVYKLNVDEAPQIAARYGMMSIPTLILFKSGAEASRLVGVQSKQAILKMFQ